MYLNKIDVSDAVYGRCYLALVSTPLEWIVVTVGSFGWFDAEPYTFRQDQIVDLYELPKERRDRLASCLTRRTLARMMIFHSRRSR